MSSPDTSSAEFFEAKYRAAADADPWKFASATYELQRYDAILHALAGRRFRRAFEPGCSVGVLTQKLAAHCDHVDASDFSPTAAKAASIRCADLPNVTVSCKALTRNAEWPTYDLILLSEIGYYFTQSTWADFVEVMVAGMAPGTLLIASHWLGTSLDHVQSGEQVHAALRHTLLQQTLHERHEGFVLDRWVRGDDGGRARSERLAPGGADPGQK